MRESEEAAVRELMISRLTALWAFSEAGLGGFSHALKLPLTAFSIGGLAIFWMTLMARLSPRPGAVILRALVQVLLIKALVSPHSPLGAYFAVAFQGLLGALLFGLFGSSRSRILVCLFSALAMIESAGQKVLVGWLFYGESLFKLLEKMAAKVAPELGFEGPESRTIVLVWLGIYGLGGLVIGLVIGGLARRFDERRSQGEALEAVSCPEDEASAEAPGENGGLKKSERWPAWLKASLGAILISSSLAWLSEGEAPWTQAGLLVLRSLVVLTLSSLLARWLKAHLRKSAARRSDLAELQALVAALRPEARAAWLESRSVFFVLRPMVFAESLLWRALRLDAGGQP